MGIKKLLTKEDEKVLLFETLTPHKYLNLLAGANGSGKSTLLDRIKKEEIYIDKDEEYEVISYINSENNKRYEEINEKEYTKGIVDKWNANNLSEGQSIIYSTLEFFEELKRRKKGNYVVLLDEIDSGLSVDNINMLCHLITDLIVERKDMQFFIAINNYHWVHVFKRVINMYNGQQRDINSYTEYWDFIREKMGWLLEKRECNMFRGMLS